MQTAATLIPATTQKGAEAKRRTLTQAVLKACDLLDLTQAELCDVLGVSAATVSRMRNGTYLLDPDRKEWELAVLFVRLFRSLDSMVGGRDQDAQAWLRGENLALQGAPIKLIRSIQGLVDTVGYLDAMRARV